MLIISKLPIGLIISVTYEAIWKIEIILLFHKIIFQLLFLKRSAFWNEHISLNWTSRKILFAMLKISEDDTTRMWTVYSRKYFLVFIPSLAAFHLIYMLLWLGLMHYFWKVKDCTVCNITKIKMDKYKYTISLFKT